jgi:hypothetical protein
MELKPVIILGTAAEIKKQIATLKKKDEYTKAEVIQDTCIDTLTYWYSKHYGKIGIPLIFTSSTLRLRNIVKTGLPIEHLFDVIITDEKRYSCGLKNHTFKEVGQKITFRNNTLFDTTSLKCTVCGQVKQTYVAKRYARS